MKLACLRRGRRPSDDPNPAEREAILEMARGHAADVSDVRRVATAAPSSYWVFSIGEEILFCRTSDTSASGGWTTFEGLETFGASIQTEIVGQEWRYALLAADGFRSVRILDRVVEIDDNAAIVSLPDRARYVYLSGAREHQIDLGRSLWEEFEETDPRA